MTLPDRIRELEDDLTERYGPLITSEQLRELLGYRTQAALRKALSRGAISLPVFALPKRRGRYALARDVAAWLAEQREHAKTRKSG